MIKQFLLFTTIIMSLRSHAGIDLVRENKPAAKIYLESLEKDSALPDAAFDRLPLKKQQQRLLAIAVRDLNYHLKKMCGAELEIVIVDDPKKIKFPAVVIGSLANKLGAKPTLKSELGEAFRLKTSQEMLLIGGDSPVGASYGVYELLARLGCDWVMPGVNGEVVPRKSTVTITELDFEETPSFAVRSPWYSGGRRAMTVQSRLEFKQWKLRHKQQVVRNWHPLMMVGGHTWDKLIRLYRKQFDKHPEMLALVRQPDGTMVRKGPQLESTSPEVIEIFADYIRNTFKKNNWSKNKTVCLSIGPADGGGFSQSSESMIAGSGRIDPMSGEPDVTDLQVLLANQLIKKLGKEFPNLYLGFYLYSVHADFPMRYKPDKRVLVVLADITYSRFHGLQDKCSKTRTYYGEIIKQWGRLHQEQGNPLFFRGYNWNLAENFLPYTKLKIWGEDIPYYKKLGVIGFYNEYSKAWAVLGPSDYLEAELTWNVNQSWRQVLKRYCQNAFGKGAPFVEQYYLMLVKQQSESGQEAGSYHAFPLIYGQDFLNRAFALFKKALAAAETTEQKRRIEFARFPIEMLKHFLEFRNAYCQFAFVAAKRNFELMKSELKRYEEIDANLVCRSATRYLDRFFKPFVDAAAKYSSGDYKIVCPLPDSMKTAFDSNSCGQSMGFARLEVNDRDYLTTHTYSSTWDAQGLMGYRSGSVWYRVRIPVAASLKDKPMGLFVGGGDSIVRVWCNGRYIGTGQGFARPFTFDLTGLVKPGQNLLAIQVQRFGNSEIGTGGLIYPSFVFSGPRLLQRAPQTRQIERILPGGEWEPVRQP